MNWSDAERVRKNDTDLEVRALCDALIAARPLLLAFGERCVRAGIEAERATVWKHFDDIIQPDPAAVARRVLDEGGRPCQS